jgi:hypothetical protein
MSTVPPEKSCYSALSKFLKVPLRIRLPVGNSEAFHSSHLPPLSSSDQLTGPYPVASD